MNKHLYLLIPFAFLLFLNASFSQTYCSPPDCRFWAVQSDEIDSVELTYAKGVWSMDEWDNAAGCFIPLINTWQCEDLKLLLFYPKLPPAEKRPLVVLIHGGAFVEGDYNAFRQSARDLASRGYVAATLNYRLCKRNNCLFLKNGVLNLCNLDFWNDFATGAYVATQDANTAVHYLQDHADLYHIDKDNIILGGHSAGAWTALNMAFLDQDEANSLQPGWEKTWGPLEPLSGIRAVIDLAGAVMDTSFIDADENIPVFAVHGTCDPVVGYGTNPPFHCSTYPKIHGGGVIATRLHHLGHPYYLFTGVNMGHDVSPLVAKWFPDMLRFVYEAGLCGLNLHHHAVETLTPFSPECQSLANNVQLPQIPYAAAGLPDKPLWGDFPQPCGNGPVLVGISEKPAKPSAKLYPTRSSDGYFTLETQQPVWLRAYDVYGKMVYQQHFSEGTHIFQLPESIRGLLFATIQCPDMQPLAFKILR